MARPSSIDRLKPELRDLVVTMRARGAIIEEILAELHARGASVSRSALGRYVKKADAASAAEGALARVEIRLLEAHMIEIKGLLKAILERIGGQPRRRFFIW